MSAAKSEAAVERVAQKRTELGVDDFAAYAFLMLGMLAHQAPEVVEFILDRADAAVGGDEVALTDVGATLGGA